jgi:hypothetical protein
MPYPRTRSAPRVVIAIILLLLLPGVIAALLRTVDGLVNATFNPWPLAGGLAIGIILDILFFRRLPGFEVFEHELTHALAAILLFRRIDRFVATGRKGGCVIHRNGLGGELGNDFIALAPYTLPTFTLLSVLVRPFLGREWFPYFDVWIGITFGYHLLSNLREVRTAWTRRRFHNPADGRLIPTDIQGRGFVFSSVYITTISLAVLGLMLAIIAQGYSGTLGWARHIGHTEVDLVQTVSESAQTLLASPQ